MLQARRVSTVTIAIAPTGGRGISPAGRGHDRADMTQVFAERIESLATKVAGEVA
jgi:hypothetical protein